MSFDRRLVIDTGILISAAIRPESIPALAFEKALSQFDPCSSEETLDELKTVLLRPKFERYLSRAIRQRFLDEYLLHTIVFPVTKVITDCRDLKDNKFLALAETVAPSDVMALTDDSVSATPIDRSRHSREDIRHLNAWFNGRVTDE